MDSSFRAISCDISHACSCSISNLQVVALRCVCVMSGRATDRTNSTLTEGGGGLGNSSRPHTRGLPYQPRRTQPVTRPPTLGVGAQAQPHLVWCARRPAATRLPTGRRRVSVSYHQADGRQEATAAQAAALATGVARIGAWLAGPSKGQGGVAESAQPANNLPTPIAMPCHASLWPQQPPSPTGGHVI